MEKFIILVDALSYIEARLCEPFSQAEAAAACHCSLSALQKLFRRALRVSMKEYVSKRRLTCAARDLSRGGVSVTETAMRYQYNSPEVFTRAFARVWGVTPSQYAGTWRFTGLFPKITLTEQGGNGMAHRQVDISELYDELQRRRDGYVLCFDIQGLMAVNEIAYEAGDLVILEALRRLDEAAGEDMLLFRIGGDEFALVTGLEERKAVEEVARRVLARNGQPVAYQGREIPVALHAAALRCGDGPMRYAQLFSRLHEAIEGSKTEDKALLFRN